MNGTWQMRLVVREQNYHHGGKLIRARTDFTAGSTQGWLTTDRLGSVVYRDGNVKKYRPYGDEYSVTTSNQDKFGTYYRDDVTGLDYADQRYYSSGVGRFEKPDSGPASLTSPQSWNRYSYAWSDPVNHNDPDGRLPGSVVDDNLGSPGCIASAFHGSGGAVDPSSNCPPGTVAVSVPRFASAGPSRLSVIAAAFDSLSDIVEDWDYADEAGGSFYVQFTPAYLRRMELPEDSKMVLLLRELLKLAKVIPVSAVLALTILQTGSSRPGSIMPSDCKEEDRETTPANPGRDYFEPIKNDPCKINHQTGEVWCRDKLHGDHYEVYKDRREYEQSKRGRGKRDRSVWDNGCIRQKF